MFVPCKPHTTGNVYHYMYCGLSEIIFFIEMVEGKDTLRERGQPKFHVNGKTGGLLLRLYESISHTGKIVLLDSGLCVLIKIIVLKKVGVYNSVLIKKRRHGIKYIGIISMHTSKMKMWDMCQGCRGW